MSNQEIVKKVIEIALDKASNTSLDASSVTESTSFIEDMGTDSLDLVEIVMTLEEEFGISIPEDDVAEIKTVGDAVKYIENSNK